MSWALITAFFEAVPKVVDLLTQMVGKLDALVIAQQQKRDQEIRDAQNELTRQINGVINDQQRAALARQISDLEQRIVSRK